MVEFCCHPPCWGSPWHHQTTKKHIWKVPFFVKDVHLLSLFSRTPIGEWPSPPPTPCRTCRTPLSTATMTAAWRNQRLPAASHRLVLALDPWPCLRTTMREPLQMAALERPSTLKMVRWQSPWSVVFSMNMYLNVNDSNRVSLCLCVCGVVGSGDVCGRFVCALWPFSSGNVVTPVTLTCCVSRWLCEMLLVFKQISARVGVLVRVCVFVWYEGAGGSCVSILLISRSSVRHP